MTKRTSIHVVPQREEWAVKEEGRVLSTHDTKAEAVDRATKAAKSAPLGQVVIHKSDGTIETEHTYGKDPSGVPG